MNLLTKLQHHINTCKACYNAPNWEDMCEDGMTLYLDAKSRYGEISISKSSTGLLIAK